MSLSSLSYDEYTHCQEAKRLYGFAHKKRKAILLAFLFLF